MELPEPETPARRPPVAEAAGAPTDEADDRDAGCNLPPVAAGARLAAWAATRFRCGIARDAAAGACRALDRVTTGAAGALCDAVLAEPPGIAPRLTIPVPAPAIINVTAAAAAGRSRRPPRGS